MLKNLILIIIISISYTLLANSSSSKIYIQRKKALYLIEKKQFEKINVHEFLNGMYIFTVEEQLLLLLLNKREHGFLNTSLRYQRYITFECFGCFDNLLDQYYLDNNILNLLEENVIENKIILKQRIDSIFKINDQSDYIKMYIEKIDINKNFKSNILKFVELHKLGCEFLVKYPNSQYKKLVDYHFGHLQELKWYASDINVGVGGGRNFGFLSDNVKRSFGVDIDFKAYIHSTFIGLRGNANFNIVKQNITINNILLPGGNDAYFVSYYDMYLGRKFDFKHRFSILPHIGTGLSEFYYIFNQDTFMTKYAINLNYGFDLNYNFKKQIKQQNFTSKYKRTLSDNVGYFRLSVQFHHSGLEKYSNSLKGIAMSINLGVGGHFRTTKRSVLYPK